MANETSDASPSSQRVAAVAAEVAAETLQGRDADFLGRVYQGSLERYRQRLLAIGFDGLADVLDAGAGFGQWAIALRELNRRVVALEYEPARCRAMRRIADRLALRGLDIVRGSTEQMPLPAAAFDAVFSYSTVFLTDWRRSLAECARVLRPGGRLYFTANGIGWSLYNVWANPNPSVDFSPRWNAVRAIVKSLTGGLLLPKANWVLHPRQVRRQLQHLGFGQIEIAGDGLIRTRPDVDPPSFYKPTWNGMTNCYEVLAVRHDG